MRGACEGPGWFSFLCHMQTAGLCAGCIWACAIFCTRHIFHASYFARVEDRRLPSAAPVSLGTGRLRVGCFCFCGATTRFHGVRGSESHGSGVVAAVVVVLGHLFAGCLPPLLHRLVLFLFGHRGFSSGDAAAVSVAGGFYGGCSGVGVA